MSKLKTVKGSNTGRPKKAEDKVYLEICSRYYFTECRNQPELLSERGIYQKLADYASKLGFDDLKEYDFRRNEAVRKHLKDIRRKSNWGKKLTATGIAYKPLDMAAMEGISKEELLEILRARDGYYETVCQSAGSVAEQEKAIILENKTLKNTVDQLEAEMQEIRRQFDALKTNYMEAVKCTKIYKKIIHDHVTPERAQQLLEHAPRPGVINEEALAAMREIGQQKLARPQVSERPPEFDPAALFGGEYLNSK